MPVLANTSKCNPKSHAYTKSNLEISSALVDNENIDSIEILLKQEDERIIPEKGTGYGWKLKPKAFFNKALGRNKKLKDKRGEVALSRSYTDITKSMKGSMTDLKQIFDNKFRNPVADGSNMTRLLVRTMMVTPLSLHKIHEHDDSEPALSKPFEHILKKYPEIAITNNKTYQESDINVSSSSISSSFTSSLTDESEDECITSTTQPSEPETVSMVVKTVREEEKRHHFIEPSTIFDTDLNEALMPFIPFGAVEFQKDNKGNIVHPHLVETGDANPHIYTSFLDSDTDSVNWIKPGSTAGEPEIKEEPRHDFLHSITEKLHSLQDHVHLGISQHFQSNNDSIIKHPNNPGLLETAMATMLIEKLNICEASAGLIPVDVSETVLKAKDETKIYTPLIGLKDGSFRKTFSHNQVRDISSIRRTQSNPNMKGSLTEPQIKHILRVERYYNDNNEKIEESISSSTPNLSDQRPKNSEHIFQGLKKRLHQLSDHVQADASEFKDSLFERMHNFHGKVRFHNSQFSASTASAGAYRESVSTTRNNRKDGQNAVKMVKSDIIHGQHTAFDRSSESVKTVEEMLPTRS